jgi:hypothetical protein
MTRKRGAIDAPGFIVAQLIGAVVVAYLFGWLFAPARDTS